MAITQLSVFLENKPGQLAEAVKEISEAGINIRALSVADTKDFGILRMIVSDISKTKALLSEKVIVTETSVIAVKMDDQAGALSKILNILAKENINLEYIYAFTGPEAYSAYVVLRLDDTEHAESVLNKSGIPTLSNTELKNIF